MIVRVYVEGPSDVTALNTLWKDWREKMRNAGWGISISHLDNKSKFLRKIGPRAAANLRDCSNDLVVGLPDYYPNQSDRNVQHYHDTFDELLSLQRTLVCDSLKNSGCNANTHVQRFYPSALKHDLEMLLLAARNQLRAHLDTSDSLSERWRHPVEEQNQNRPPKRIVEELYREKRKRAYRDTTDAPAVLGKVTNLEDILYSESKQLECPVFKDLLDWMAGKTGVPYQKTTET